MNAVSADEDVAGLEKLPPKGAREGRMTGKGRHPVSAWGDASTGFWADSLSYWAMHPEALPGRELRPHRRAGGKHS